MKQRNVLVIMTDQHNFRCLGHQGHPDLKTPVLDRLAAESTVFQNAFTASPVCQPARVSMLSGQRVCTHRQFGFEGMQSPDVPLFSRSFREAGYMTGMVGKLHIASLPPDCGADFISSTMVEDSWRVCGGGTAYEDYVRGAGFAYPTDQTHGGYPNTVAPSHADPGEPENVRMTGRSDIPLEHSVERWTADEALRFLNKCKSLQRPFWMWLTFDRPHAPWAVSAPYDTLYDPELLTLSPRETEAQILKKPPTHLRDLSVASAVNEKYFRRILASYYGLISHIDAEVGRVLDWLRQEGMYEDTTVVYTADHGDGGGTAGLMEKCRGIASGEVVRIPMIIKPAAVQAEGRRIEAPLELIDLFPTLAAWHQIPCPETIDGRDCTAVFHGKPLDPDHAAICEHYTEKSIYQNGWRLVYYVGAASLGELYHTEVDNEERENLYADPVTLSKRVALKLELIKKLSPPFTPEDTRTIDEVVFKHTIRHIKWRPTQKVSPDCPISVNEGRGLWLINSKLWQVFLRLDTGKHVVYRTQDYFEKRVDVFGSAEFAEAELEQHLDWLLDWLFLRLRPMDIVGPCLDSSGYRNLPVPGDVSRFTKAMKGKKPWKTAHQYYWPKYLFPDPPTN
jgi:arylsulfatase A-like enzyme